MDANEYQQAALRTDITDSIFQIRGGRINGLINGLMGLNGESGECIDILKKHLFQGHELDRVHLAKELGDVAWYLAVSADALGYRLSEILEMNVAKLMERYPDGFDADKSLHRKDEDV